MKVLLVACFALLTVASGFPTVSHWTLEELSYALQSADTNPLMVPFLESALNDMMTATWNGANMPYATIVLPANVAAAMNPVIVEPVIVEPVIVDPVMPGEVGPVAPVEQPKISPLVQIILNINSNQGSVSVPVSPVAPETVVPPAPETVAPPTPEFVDVAILPEFVDVAILPETVDVAEPVNPIDDVAISPLPVNPIDQVAIEAMPVNPIDQVAIEAMPVNPVDIMAPIGVVGPSTDGIHV